tara:strand:- start:2081 stop:2920 length:840 start_codon:yes stop_codon:yes gene_type:complete
MSKSFFKLILFLILFFSFFDSNAQNSDYKKGDFYTYWGWNWSWYSKSDIHFKGDNYDFKIHKAKAQDRQSEFSVDTYLNPANMTIPQYNFRFGYFIKKNVDISFGIDHLKYVVEQNQIGRISGFINNTGTKYDGVYNNTLLPISEDFLKLEYTDGLNYINFEIRKHSSTFVLPIGALGSKNNLKLKTIYGVGLGFMLPKTDSTLLNNERNDNFYLSGYGLNSMVGLNVKLFKNFFFQTELKGGYVSLPNIRTTSSKIDKASQDFFYAQYNVVFGYSWQL